MTCTNKERAAIAKVMVSFGRRMRTAYFGSGSTGYCRAREEKKRMTVFSTLFLIEHIPDLIGSWQHFFLYQSFSCGTAFPPNILLERKLCMKDLPATDKPTTADTDRPLQKLLQISSNQSTFLPPFDSLPSLHAYVSARCTVLMTEPLVAFPEFYSCDPGTTSLILRLQGYFPCSPLLRIWFLHQVVCVPDHLDIALSIVRLLYLDVSRIFTSLENGLRECLVRPLIASSSLTSTSRALPCPPAKKKSRCHATVPCDAGSSSLCIIQARAFTLQLRRDTHLLVDDVKRNGKQPALLILPSLISIANLGLWVRGSIPAKVTLLGYGGVQESQADQRSDISGSGYRMTVSSKIVLDARVARCLCSMINDPKYSPFSVNVRFHSGGHRSSVKAVTVRRVCNEELFVCYGTSFQLHLEEAALSFNNFLCPDYALLVPLGRRGLPEAPQ